ncbi:HD domain-containing protein [Rhodovibrionaceae bacterium A322]
MLKDGDTVDFVEMKDGTQAEYEFLDAQWQGHFGAEGLKKRVLDLLEDCKGPKLGYKVDRYEHSLQSATRALRDKRSNEYVVAALLHDIGDHLAPENHSEFIAALLRPYVSEKTYWILKHHGIFQGYYFWHHLGGDQNARDRFKDHPWFDDCAEFCAKYDQNCFDPDYDTEPLETFMPMIDEILGRKAWQQGKSDWD